VAKFAFLSPEWIEAARQLHASAANDGEEPGDLKMNLVIEQVPFGDGRMEAHLDTTSGVLDIDLGHLEEPDVVVSLEYLTAKAVLVDQDSEAAMSAFMAGRVRVEGDMTKLLNYQAGAPTPRQQQLAAALREITE
jgi:hypothetical protein